MALQVPDTNGTMVPVVGFHPDRCQTITNPTSSTAVSSNFNAETQVIYVIANVAVHIEVEDSPVATTSHVPLAAWAGLYIATKGKKKIAAILNSGTTGTVWVQECC